jgi:iron complex outermembrane recepter protein
VTWVLGAYYFHEIAKFDPVHLYGDLLAPVGTILGYSTSRTSSGSLYGQATFDVLSDSHLTLGAREIVERRSIGITENIYLLNGALADQEATRDEKTFDKPTWRIAFDHTFSPGILGYLSYNRGFKSGGFNPLILPAKSFAPEHLDAYEIGLKTSLFGNRLRLNTAVYDYDYKNIQVVSYRRSLLEVANGAAATLYGLDADFELAATDDLTLKAGLSLLRATFDSYPNADLTTPAPAGGTLYATGSARGKHLPFAPAWTFNTGIDYSIPMPFGRALLNMTYLHNAGWYAAPDNRLRQKAYDVLNGRLGWQSPHASYEFSLWIKNILNEDYATTIFSQVRGDVIEYAPPRTFGLTLQKKF